MKKIFFAFLLALSCVQAFSQDPILWEKTINCPKDVFIGAGLQTKNGDILFVARFNGKKTVLFAYSETGAQLWNKKFPIETRGVIGMWEADDGSLMFCGYAMTKDNGVDGFLSCLEKSGDLRWVKYYGKKGHETFSGFVRSENSYYFAGTSPSEDGGSTRAYIVKTDLNGELLWNYAFEKYEFSLANNLAINVKNEVIVCGQARKDEKNSSLVLKITSDGKYVTDKLFFDDKIEHACFIVPLQDHYILVSWRSFKPIKIRMINSSFNLLSEKDQLENGAIPSVVSITKDAIFIAGDSSQDMVNGIIDTDLFWVKVSLQGDILQTVEINHPSDRYESANALFRTNDNQWLLIGNSSEGRIFLIKIRDL